MDPGIIAALIAAGISIIGGFASVVISRNATKKEMDLHIRTLREEADKIYREKVLQKRMEVYPELNVVVMTFWQKLRREGMSSASFSKLYQGLLDWEVNHSFMLSFKAREELTNLKTHLRKALSADGVPSLSNRKDIIESLRNLSLKLKGDLGVLRIEFENSEDGYFKSEDELYAFNEQEEKVKEEEAKSETESSDQDNGDADVPEVPVTK